MRLAFMKGWDSKKTKFSISIIGYFDSWFKMYFIWTVLLLLNLMDFKIIEKCLRFKVLHFWGGTMIIILLPEGLIETKPSFKN